MEKQQREKEREKKKRAKQRKKDNKEKDAREAEELKVLEEQERALEQQREEEVVMAAGICAFCSISLFRKKVYDIFDRRCCSGSCVIALRRRLQAEAAEKRFGGAGAR